MADVDVVIWGNFTRLLRPPFSLCPANCGSVVPTEIRAIVADRSANVAVSDATIAETTWSPDNVSGVLPANNANERE